MSNHAYVVPEILPTAETIDTDLRRIVAAKFPLLTVDYCDETWEIKFKDQTLRILWIGKYHKTPCIEFRHGGGGDFCWWVEDEIRGAIAKLYNAKQYDDAFEEEYISSVEYTVDTRTFPTLKAWLETIWAKQHDYIDMSLKYAKVSIPIELHNLI